jgi:protein subunit release factor B
MFHPPPYNTDLDVLERECELEFFIASGPGGQHRNKRETGVRLFHPASGLTVTATERRSQTRNLEVAFARLIARLETLNRPRIRRIATRPSLNSIRRRQAAKKQASEKKQMRRKISGDHD